MRFDLLYFLFLFLLLYAAWTDYRLRIIPNWITLGLFFIGLVYRLLNSPRSWPFIGLSIVLIILLYILHFWAEGDVKLAVALSLWLVPQFLLLMALWYCIFLLLWGIGWMAKNKSINIQLSYPAGILFLGSFVCASVTPFFLLV